MTKSVRIAKDTGMSLKVTLWDDEDQSVVDSFWTNEVEYANALEAEGDISTHDSPENFFECIQYHCTYEQL